MNTLEYVYQRCAVRGRDKKDPCRLIKFTRDQMAVMFHELGFRRGAEIGVHLGAYSKVLCDSIPGVELHSIDVWDLEDVYRQAMKTLWPYSNCRLIRVPSLDAANLYADESFDFIYIDANHHYEHIKADIEAWAPKVRKGGIVSGHDYHNLKPHRCQVIKAVDEYTAKYKIDPWFVVAGDRESSWFWVKE
jgi:predicted O-methyltransferase YrrM